jgi:hypothetical protein
MIRFSYFWPAVFGLLVGAPAQTELLLVLGEERRLEVSYLVGRAVVEDPSRCELRLESDGKTVVLTARRTGVSGLKLWDDQGVERGDYLLRIFSSAAELLRRDVSERLKGLSGVEVKVEGERVLLRGAARSLEDLKKVREVARDFPELLDLVALDAAPAAPPPPESGTTLRLGEMTVVAPALAGWTLEPREGGFLAGHAPSGARVQARTTRLSRGMSFKEAEALLTSDTAPPEGERRQRLAARSLRLGEHEASLSEWIDARGNSGYLLILTATPFPINLDYVLIEARLPPAGVPAGESFFAQILRSLGDSSFAPRPGIPYLHSRAAFFLRYPRGWTVGGETGEAAGFYQNPDNRPVVNITAERLPGSYPGGAGLARASAVLFERARARGAFRVERESSRTSEEPWQRRIVFEGARPLRQLQAILLREERAYAVILTAEPELASIHEPAFQQTLASFRILEETGARP